MYAIMKVLASAYTYHSWKINHYYRVQLVLYAESMVGWSVSGGNGPSRPLKVEHNRTDTDVDANRVNPVATRACSLIKNVIIKTHQDIRVLLYLLHPLRHKHRNPSNCIVRFPETFASCKQRVYIVSHCPATKNTFYPQHQNFVTPKLRNTTWSRCAWIRKEIFDVWLTISTCKQSDRLKIITIHSYEMNKITMTLFPPLRPTMYMASNRYYKINLCQHSLKTEKKYKWWNSHTHRGQIPICPESKGRIRRANSAKTTVNIKHPTPNTQNKACKVCSVLYVGGRWARSN